MIDLGWDATAACMKLFVLESLPVPERRKDSAVYSGTSKPKQGRGKPEVGTKKIAPGCPRLRRVISPDGTKDFPRLVHVAHIVHRAHLGPISAGNLDVAERRAGGWTDGRTGIAGPLSLILSYPVDNCDTCCRSSLSLSRSSYVSQPMNAISVCPISPSRLALSL